MPFIHLMTTRSYFPPETAALDDTRQRGVINLLEDLPEAILNHAQLNLEDTPLEGIQVTYGMFPPRSINVPNLGFYILFTEPKPGDEAASHITRTLAEIIEEGVKAFIPGEPRLSMDVFWANSHGFLRFGTVQARW